MNNNTGGPAFPFEYFDKQLDQNRVMAGMTIRDYFAAKAMQALIHKNYFDVAAKEAYQMADAMLEARKE